MKKRKKRKVIKEDVVEVVDEVISPGVEYTRSCDQCGKPGWMYGDFPISEEITLNKYDRLFYQLGPKFTCVDCMYK